MNTVNRRLIMKYSMKALGQFSLVVIAGSLVMMMMPVVSSVPMA